MHIHMHILIHTHVRIRMYMCVCGTMRNWKLTTCQCCNFNSFTSQAHPQFRGILLPLRNVAKSLDNHQGLGTLSRGAGRVGWGIVG